MPEVERVRHPPERDERRERERLALERAGLERAQDEHPRTCAEQDQAPFVEVLPHVEEEGHSDEH